MRVLLDTNVILDAMLRRAPWHHEADAILMAAANGLNELILHHQPLQTPADARGPEHTHRNATSGVADGCGWIHGGVLPAAVSPFQGASHPARAPHRMRHRSS